MQSVSVIFAAAAVTVGLGIVASIGTFLWWRAHGASDVERLAFNVSDFLGEVIAQGGLSRDRYRTQDRLRVEAELGELGQHLRDRKLRKLVRVALEEYRKAGAAARPKPRVVTRARA